MLHVVKIGLLIAGFLLAGIGEAAAASSITVPLPFTASDVAGMIPRWARSMEFLVGVVAGVLLNEFGRSAWRWGNKAWAVGLNAGTHLLRYGSVAAVIGGLLFLI